jgi:hypothetical protein
MSTDGRIDRFYDPEYQSKVGKKALGVAKTKKELPKQ